MLQFTVGDNIKLSATLLLNGGKEPLGAYTAVYCAITNLTRTALANGTSVVACSIIDPLEGRVDATFPSAQTEAIVPGKYLVEFRAVAGTEKYTYDREVIEIVEGAIP